MKHEIQPILSLIPPGAKLTGKYLDPADNSKIIIEYFYEGGLVRITPERLDIDDFITYDNHFIYLLEGLTYNDVYEIYSKRFGLDFIKDEDYLDNPEVITATGRIYLPINPLSTRYQNNTLIIDIVRPQDIFSGTEKDRNLVGKDVNPYPTILGHKLRFLNTYLVDGTGIDCFEGNIPSIEFRDLIVKKSGTVDENVINEVKSSYVINAFNDGISDIVIMLGPTQTPYSIRFVSKEGDIPVLE